MFDAYSIAPEEPPAPDGSTSAPSTAVPDANPVPPHVDDTTLVMAAEVEQLEDVLEQPSQSQNGEMTLSSGPEVEHAPAAHALAVDIEPVGEARSAVVDEAVPESPSAPRPAVLAEVLAPSAAETEQINAKLLAAGRDSIDGENEHQPNTNGQSGSQIVEAESFDEVALSSVDGPTASLPAVVVVIEPPASDSTTELPLPPAKDAPSPKIPSAADLDPSAKSHQPSPSISHSVRRSSLASTTTVSGPGSSSLVSGVLIISSLELIAASKEAKRSLPLKNALDAALEALKHPQPSEDGATGGTVDPLVVFLPLRLACETKSLGIMISALDCIGKLVSYDFFVDDRVGTGPGGAASGDVNKIVVEETNEDGEAPERKEGEAIPLADLITTTVCDCFSPSPASGSTTAAPSTTTTQHDTLLLRLLSSLLSLILSWTLSVHQSSLLKAVRTVYNVFLMGSAGTVQTVASATLGQIVSGVFGRVARGDLESIKAAAGLSRSGSVVTLRNGSSAALNGAQTPSDSERRPSTSVSTSARASKVDLSTVDEDDTTVVQDELPAVPIEAEEGAEAKEDISAKDGEEPITLAGLENRKSFEGVPDKGPLQYISTNDLYIKDAFLVFRALCKLSMKPLGPESERDLKSHAMRSKLLSLHLVLTILNSHLGMFIDPSIVIHSASSRDRTPFIQAVKQYLCLALSRNAVSPVAQVFELSCEIFWRVLSGMRSKLKKEIEVLLNEIFLPILEMKNSTQRQKSMLLAVFGRLAQDPQALVDIYLNYDCDRASSGNIYERLLNIISKLGTTHFAPTTERPGVSTVSATASSPFPTTGPTLVMDSKMNDPAFAGQSPESHLKRQSLECLVAILRSLVSWSARGNPLPASMSTSTISHMNRSDSISLPAVPGGFSAEDVDLTLGSTSSLPYSPGSGAATPDATDAPSRFENARQKKTTLLEGIKKFNFKPKRGIGFLIDTGFIASKEPKEIALFLLTADGLSKAQIGEYLGEGEPANIAAMHAFVDLMDFSNSPFVNALRTFLQSFRLPGEAQKIDRYMLKFAERYTAGNSGVFANADTAYILAFSVILLNTDAHNPQVKRPMSKPEFIKNNRGIDDGKDLPEELLSSIYDEINENEIRMKDEVEAAGPQVAAGGIASAIATVGRDLQREAYVWQSEGMANKTEALFRTMVRGQRRGGARSTEEFYSASHFEHVKPMLEVAWMPILAGISGPLQDSDDLDLITLSLEGFKQAIKIVCLFDLELERNAFVTTLAKFTFLNNLGEMKPKNVEAIKTLLDIAMVDGNYLKGSWKEVLTCVSQLERFQLIANGVDSQTVPELGRKPVVATDRRSILSRSRNSRPTDEVAQETRSQHITITADMIFSSTPQLSGTAIVHFVQALSEVSWEEIQSSGQAEQPRVFSLQKLVEISYYNMSRIRLEWSGIWTILGEHFNQVTCHSNAKVSFLALDSLRQLAMRFLEKEELANFKFQKDFLRPFEYAMIHNNNPEAKDMVLQCLQQMIQARVQNLRSGWRTMFAVFSAASKVPSERIALQAFELVQRVNKEHFSSIIAYGSFADLTVCITDFSKINKWQRASLQAIEMLKAVIPMMLTCPECPLSSPAEVARLEGSTTDDPVLRFWFPILFGFYDVIMNGEDLEVRKRALDYLFETLKKHGASFPAEFWDTVTKEVLFPIFSVLRSQADVSRFSTHEDMSVWLSTTMIQALRNLVDLFTFYFDILGRMLDKLLDLLCECICQENDTLARIGTSCLQQLLEQNVHKLSPARWEKIVSTFVHLFQTTTAYQLFDENLRIPQPDNIPNTPDVVAPTAGFITPAPLSVTVSSDESNSLTVATALPASFFADRRRIFRQIIVKCVLQLLLIETTHELLQNEAVYTMIPPEELLKLMAALDESYRFAKRFNAEKELRLALWKVGFMKQLPNLLRQESSSAATLVNVLLRMYTDEREDHIAKRDGVVDVFAPLGLDVLAGFIALDPETQARNIAAWTAVVAEILSGFSTLEDQPFIKLTPQLYPLATALLGREMDPSVRESVRVLLIRVGSTSLGISE